MTSLDRLDAPAVEGHPQRWWALGVLCLTLAMVALDNTILNVALPRVATELEAGENELQWISTSYSLVLAGLLLPIAVVGDRRGRKGLLVVGLAIFGLASGAAAWATTPAQLVVCRGLQGVGGACAMPATLSLLGNLFPEHERGRAIAIWSAVAGVSGAAGPVLGGLLVEHFWWGTVFLVNVPVAVVAVVAALVLVPQSTDPNTPRVDGRSALAWWGALTATLVAIIELPEDGIDSPVVLGAAALAGVLLVAFRAQERRTDGPLIDQETAADPRMLAGGLTMAALFFTMFGGQFVVTQWLQGPQELSPIAAGLCFLPSAAAAMVCPLLNVRLVARWGHGLVAGGALVLVAFGAFGIAVGVGLESIGIVAALFVLVGAGLGLASPSGAELIMSSAPAARAGSAAGVNETLVEASGALGVGVLGSLLVGGHWVRPLPVAGLVGLAAATAVFRVLRRA